MKTFNIGDEVVFSLDGYRRDKPWASAGGTIFDLSALERENRTLWLIGVVCKSDGGLRYFEEKELEFLKPSTNFKDWL